MGPTPPGTGVIAFALSLTSSKLTSPTILSRRTKNKAYSMKKVSFEENKSFKKSKIEKFIKYHSKQLYKS